MITLVMVQASKNLDCNHFVPSAQLTAFPSTGAVSTGDPLMLEEIARFHGFCAWLIEDLACPCRDVRGPVAVVCRFLPPVSRVRARKARTRRPRAGRRRRSRRTALGSADPDGGSDGPPDAAATAWRAVS